MAAPAPDSVLPARAFALEPYAYAEARALAQALELAEPVAVTLVRRGYRTPEAARAFLEASESHDPFAFAGMEEVVARVRAAIAAGRRITVHGDYDVDGVSSTAIVVGALRALGAECDWYVPDRLGDGYGLTVASVERLAARGTELLITVDCGITCVAEVAAARDAGLDVIVTDHHQPEDELPDCPILHPVVSGYPCEDLCATGVAYKLAAALRGAESAESDLDLVALATVADLVPLLGENRSLVRRGLALARLARRPGMRALIAAAAIEPERLDEGDLAFRLGPRINAAGRLYRADAGVELMLTDDPDRAVEIAGELDRVNRERREIEREVAEQAERARSALPAELAEAAGLVVAGHGWHPGVVGIVASRLVERHGRPVVLIALDSDGRGRGSGRSVPGFDLLAALRACDRHLVRYGGHRAAAGLEIEAGSVEAFREAFAAHAAAALGEAPAVRSETVDAVVGGEDLGLDVAEQFARLAPFGKGNPQVRLLVPAARVRDVRPMGDGERHARFSLESGSGRARGVAFSVNGKLANAEEEAHDVSISLEINHWNGAVEPRVVLGELYPGLAAAHSDALPSDEQWLARVALELDRPLAAWPPPDLVALAREGSRRAVVDRRGRSGVAALAGLASSGEPVLAICADAVRRRDLVERAAAPARFGGGEVAVAAGRLCDEQAGAAVAAVLQAGAGVALADWQRLAREPGLPCAFEHIILIDPPPFAHLEDLADRSGPGGFLHLAWGSAETELSLRLHDAEWPQRPALARVYGDLRQRASGAPLAGGALRGALAGPGRHARSPEVAARCLRVLLELELAQWENAGPVLGSATPRALRVVSSEGTELDRSEAFGAYRARHEEGRRYLSRRQAT